MRLKLCEVLLQHCFTTGSIAASPIKGEKEVGGGGEEGGEGGEGKEEEEEGGGGKKREGGEEVEGEGGVAIVFDINPNTTPKG